MLYRKVVCNLPKFYNNGDISINTYILEEISIKMSNNVALLKAQVSLQLGKMFSSDHEVSV